MIVADARHLILLHGNGLPWSFPGEFGVEDPLRKVLPWPCKNVQFDIFHHMCLLQTGMLQLALYLARRDTHGYNMCTFQERHQIGAEADEKLLKSKRKLPPESGQTSKNIGGMHALLRH